MQVRQVCTCILQLFVLKWYVRELKRLSKSGVKRKMLR